MHVSVLRVCVGAAWVNSLPKHRPLAKQDVCCACTWCSTLQSIFGGGTSRSGISRQPHSNTAVAL